MCLFGGDLAILIIACIKKGVEVIVVHFVQEKYLVFGIFRRIVDKHIEHMTILRCHSDELHFFRIVNDLFRLDKGSVAVRIIIGIAVIVGIDLRCPCLGKVAHDLTELLHIIGSYRCNRAIVRRLRSRCFRSLHRAIIIDSSSLGCSFLGNRLFRS